MIRLDRFYTEPASNLLVHKEYPPLAAIFEMLFCHLQLKYSEMSATMGLHFLEFSLLAPWLTEHFDSDGKHWLERFLNAFMLFMIELSITLIFDHYTTFLTIYTDILMPIMFAYIISLVMDKDIRDSRFGFAAMLLGQVSMILTKQMCIIFVALAMFYYLLLSWEDLTGLDKHKRKIFIVRFLIIATAVIGNYLLWNHYAHSLGQNGQFDLKKIRPEGIFEILLGGGTKSQHEASVRYLQALYSSNIIKGVFSMSFLSSMAPALGLLLLIYQAARKHVSKKVIINTAVMIISGYIGYAFTMFVLYMFCYSEAEMLGLASYSRYMGSYLLAAFLVILYFAVIFLKRSGRFNVLSWKKLIVLLGALVLIAGADRWSFLLPQMINGEPYKFYREQAKRIERNTEEGSVILTVSRSNLQNTYYLNYYLNERKLNFRFAWSNIPNYAVDDTEKWDAALDIIRDDDYMYVFDVSESLTTVLGPYTDGGELLEYTLYKIDSDEENLKLKKVDG